MDSFTEGTLAVVFFGESFVELSEGGVSLQDVCDAFGVTYGSGVFVKDKATGQPVATLPFEPVFTPSVNPDRADTNDTLEELDNEEPILLELVCPEGNKPKAALPGAPPPGGEVAIKREPGTPDDATNAVMVDDSSAVETLSAMLQTAAQPTPPGGNARLASVVEAASSSMDVAMRELVKLGAVELLSADSAQRIAQLPPYSARDAPGLLKKLMYPPSQYSPFRARRDPLVGASGKPNDPQDLSAHQRHSPNARLTGLTTFQQDGEPYRSALDVYGEQLVEEEDLYAFVGAVAPTWRDAEEGTGAQTSPPVDGEAEERASAALLRQRPDLQPLTNDQLAKFFV